MNASSVFPEYRLLSLVIAIHYIILKEFVSYISFLHYDKNSSYFIHHVISMSSIVTSPSKHSVNVH